MGTANFIDYVTIYCSSGHGGAGAVHFRREKFIPKGGPDGGDGGDGGSVYVKGNKDMWTLLHLKFQRHFRAGNGHAGGRNNRTGAKGEDVYIEVPLGTVVKDKKTNKVLFEITEHEQTVLLLPGGRGGKGNSFFKSATHQAPKFAQPGESGKEGEFIFELKILADVGLVGFPNAGKSTLLATITAARPKIADYPFTTLTPNIGIVKYRDFKSFVIADIPGIIEGAAEGKGLGLRFLRHIERNSILLFMVPGDSENVLQQYYILLNELKKYNPELLEKKRVLAISKIDLITREELDKILNSLKNLDIKVVPISSVARINLDLLKDVLWNILNS